MRTKVVLAVLICSGLAFAQQETSSGSTFPQKPAPSATSRVYPVFGDVRPPKPIDSPNPKLTEEEKKLHHIQYKGTVVLEIVVAEDGSVRDAKVTRRLDAYLDNKALGEVKKWRFEPATKKGKPVAVRVNVEVNFSLY